MRQYKISGRFLKQFRIKSGKTQKEICELAGMNEAQFWSNSERGLCHIPKKNIRALKKKFKSFDDTAYILTIGQDAMINKIDQLTGK